MKKTLLIAILVMFATVLVQGQKVNFGPKIGYSASKLSTNLPDVTESLKHNFMAGLFLRIGNKLYIQPELMYHSRGGVLDSAGYVQTVVFKNLEIPVMVGFKLLDLKVFNLRFMGGPVASFALNKDISVSDLVQDPFDEADFKNVLWGLDVGLGVDVLFLSLDVRYEFGLNNVYITPDGGQSYDMKNNLWTVGLGFKLF
jgi:hypothetical protein